MKPNDWRSEGDHASEGGAEPGHELNDAPPAQRREWSKSALGVLGAFAISMAAIWGIGHQAGPATAEASAIDPNAQAAIDSLLANAGKSTSAESSRATDKLLATFYGTPGALSTPMEQLSGNPFVHGDATAPVAAAAPGVPVEAAIDPDNAHLRRLADAFHALKLQTVLVSRRSSFAMINDKLLAVGNHMGEFVLTRIQSDGVVLTADGRQFALKLNEKGEQ